MSDSNSQSKLGHMVYFTLADNSPEAVGRLLSSAREHLTDHPGTEYFAVGTRTPDLSRPVNDSEFDVALQVIFASRADHDVYQTHPRHLQFIEENKSNWKQVRVFDADVD